MRKPSVLIREPAALLFVALGLAQQVRQLANISVHICASRPTDYSKIRLGEDVDNHAAHDSLSRRLAAGAYVEPIVECIRKMRVEGLADSEIAGLFRHAADELDEGES